MKKLILLCIFLTNSALAQFTFDNVNKEDFDRISREFTSNFSHAVPEGAKGLGDVWGVEIGLAAAQTPAPTIGASSSTKDLANAGIILRTTFASDYTFTYNFIPELELSGLTFNTSSFALKYDLSWILKNNLFKFALKAHYGSTSVKFKQIISSLDTEISVDTNAVGAHLLTSLDFFMIEPYLGLGFISGSNTLAVAGTTTIFDASFTASQSAQYDETTLHIIAGLQIDLAIIQLAVEHHSLLSQSKTAAKLSLVF